MNRLLQTLVCAGGFAIGTVFAQSPVTVTIGTNATAAPPIPSDFLGLSFGMKTLLPGKDGSHFFSPTNSPLITLLENIGVKHLRMGGTTVESPPTTPIPDFADIDDFFSFARAAGVEKVIYSLRLLQTNTALNYAATNSAIATYIWTKYRERLDCFAIGNEPDLRRVFDQDESITNFATYLRKWQAFAAAITNVVPEARFAGPDGGSGNVSWTTRFAAAEENSGRLKVITEHFYVGGKGRGVDPGEAIAAMLSPGWIAANEDLYRKAAQPVMSKDLSFRFTEANDHYSGGVPDASDTFAGALWALDFLHWWAAHGVAGVNFHNTQWVVNDVITPRSDGQLGINPKGYGLKAFDLGRHGRPEPLAIKNPDNVNLTAYAVRGEKEHFVTLINKEHSSGARAAKVTIGGLERSPQIEVIIEVIRLTAPDGDVKAKTGIMLGGSPITNNVPWREPWTPLKRDKSAPAVVEVPAASAVILKISEK